MCSENGVRALTLFGTDGKPLGHLYAIAIAFVLYPEDERSRVQGLAIFDIEYAAYVNDPDAFEPSKLAQSMEKVIDKTAGQRYVAGLVALAFVVLAQDGHTDITLYRASLTVERALKKAKKNHEDRPLKAIRFDPTGDKVEGVRTPSGQREIQRAFQVYRSVAHLIAADLLTSNTLEARPVWGRTYHMDAVFLNTAAAIEGMLISHASEYFVDPWMVGPSLVPDALECGIAPLEGGFVEFVRSGVKKDDGI